MKFSKMVDYRAKPYFVCKTGRKNIRILAPGLAYENSFVVPIKETSNRRPAVLDDLPETDLEVTQFAEGMDDAELIPQ